MACTCSHNEASVVLMEGQVHQCRDGVLLRLHIRRSQEVDQKRYSSLFCNTDSILSVQLCEVPDGFCGIPLYLSAPAGQFGDELVHKRGFIDLPSEAIANSSSA